MRWNWGFNFAASMRSCAIRRDRARDVFPWTGSVEEEEEREEREREKVERVGDFICVEDVEPE